MVRDSPPNPPLTGLPSSERMDTAVEGLERRFEAKLADGLAEERRRSDAKLADGLAKERRRSDMAYGTVVGWDAQAVFTKPWSHTHAHAHTHARTHACTQAHTHTHTHAYTHMHTRTHACTHARTHTHTHAHTHAHTHTPETECLSCMLISMLSQRLATFARVIIAPIRKFVAGLHTWVYAIKSLCPSRGFQAAPCSAFEGLCFQVNSEQFRRLNQAWIPSRFTPGYKEGIKEYEKKTSELPMQLPPIQDALARLELTMYAPVSQNESAQLSLRTSLYSFARLQSCLQMS